MKITVLGCGSSGGVPLIGNNWGNCDPSNPRNRRSRPSILVEEADTILLVDTSPDMREQLLACELKTLSAVLYTHAHADHCHGIDNLRSVNWLVQKPIPVYASKETLSELVRRFDYIFNDPNLGCFNKPSLIPHEISNALQLGNINVSPVIQKHGNSNTLGYRFNDFAYSTDVSDLDEKAFQALSGVKVWVVDCVREKLHPSHAHLVRTLEWIERVKPERAYLTHMDQSLDYAYLADKLPAGVEPAYDGLVIEC